MKFHFEILPLALTMILTNSYAQSVSWLPLSKIDGAVVQDLALNSSSEIYAACSPSGLFRSTNGGSTWKIISSALSPGQFYNVGVGLTSSSTIYFFAWNAASLAGGLYRSTNQGLIWNKLAFPPGSQIATAICVSPGDTVVVGTYDRRVLRSTDGGITWAELAIAPAGTQITWIRRSITGDFFVSVFGLGLYKLKSDTLGWDLKLSGDIVRFAIGSTGAILAPRGLSGTQSLQFSTNMGETWSALSLSTVPTLGIPVNCSITEDGKLLYSTHLGLYFRDTSWTKIDFNSNVIPSSALLTVLGTIYVGSSGGGILYSTDSGTSWQRMNSGLFSPAIRAITFESPQTIFASGDGSGMHKSTDGGTSWTSLTLRTPSVVNITSIVRHPNGMIFAGSGSGSLVRFAIGGEGVFRSIDNGASWSAKNVGLDPPLSVDHLLVDKAGNIYAGTGLRGLYRSTDLGDSWTRVTPELSILHSALDSAGRIYTIADTMIVRSTDHGQSWTNMPNTRRSFVAIAALPSGKLLGSTFGQGLLASSDNGLNWVHSDSGIPPGRVLSPLGVHPSGLVFVHAAWTGTYMSTDQGDSWTQTNNIPGEPEIIDFAPAPNGGLFAATNLGIFKFSGPSTSVATSNDGSPSHFELYQNYPNPFNPSTEIAFVIPKQAIVSLRIFDLLGREIAVVPNHQMSAGSHTVSWTAQNLPTGVYIYRIDCDQFTASKRMILIK